MNDWCLTCSWCILVLNFKKGKKKSKLPPFWCHVSFLVPYQCKTCFTFVNFYISYVISEYFTIILSSYKSLYSENSNHYHSTTIKKYISPRHLSVLALMARYSLHLSVQLHVVISLMIIQ